MKLSIITCGIAMLSTLTFACSSSSSSDVDSAPDGGSSSNSAQTFPYAGFVQVTKVDTTTFVRGAFRDTTLASYQSCTTTLGGCSLIDCPTAPSDGGAPTELSAGDINIYMSELASPAVLHFDPTQGQYSAPTFTGTSFMGGDKVDINAAGDTIHGFSTSLVAPNDITVTAPVATDSVFTIDTNADLDVTWSNGSAGSSVVVYVSGDTQPDRYRSITCNFDAASGSGTVPVALLSYLGNVEKGELVVEPATTTTPACDNTSITATIVGSGVIGVMKSP
jgi:hypothetical protein